MRNSPLAFETDQSASTAVEFAFIAPILLMLLFGIIGYGHAFGVYHGVQQLAAEAARASVAGLDDAERERLARAFITRNNSSKTEPTAVPTSVTVLTRTRPAAGSFGYGARYRRSPRPAAD